MEREALSLALNRIGELGKYDLEKLRDQMIRIEAHGIMLTSNGFTVPEIDQIVINPAAMEDDDEIEDADDADRADIISQLGDSFKLGVHRLNGTKNLLAAPFL